MNKPSEPDPNNDTRRMGATMQLLTWLVLGGMLVAGFQGWLDYGENPNRQVGGDGGEAILKINRAGHYVGSGLINDRAVVFLVDTGATDVVLSAALADELGLQRGLVHNVNTAAGVIKVFDTRLDLVQLGGVAKSNVDATINPHMGDRVVLLGMSFMRDLEMVQRDDLLILRQ